MSNKVEQPPAEPANRSRCALCGRRKIFGIGWHERDALRFCKGCWPRLDPAIEWFEARSAIVHQCIGAHLANKPPLFTLLGKSQSHIGIDDGEWLTDQVIQHLSLPRGDITFEFATLGPSIAGTVKWSDGKYQVKICSTLAGNFRSVSAILIHELMHIYLNSHGIVYKTLEEYEEATDLACVLTGFGVPMINAKKAWTVDRYVLGGGGTAGGKSYHAIGYLSNEQIGYAFANFLADRNITGKDVEGQIDQHCFHIVTEGIALEREFRSRLEKRREALHLSSQQRSRCEVCEFSCPVCFQKMAVPTKTIRRVAILKAKCPKCGSVVHFDGEKIVKFAESLR